MELTGPEVARSEWWVNVKAKDTTVGFINTLHQYDSKHMSDENALH